MERSFQHTERTTVRSAVPGALSACQEQEPSAIWKASSLPTGFCASVLSPRFLHAAEESQLFNEGLS